MNKTPKPQNPKTPKPPFERDRDLASVETPFDRVLNYYEYLNEQNPKTQNPKTPKPPFERDRDLASV